MDDPRPVPANVSPGEAAVLRDTLARIAFLEYLEPHELDVLIADLRRRPFASGEVIIREGGPGDAFYILARGSVEVSRRSNAGEERINTMKGGEFFGEIALLNGVPRTATVTGESPGELYVLSREDFLNVLMRAPLIADIIRTTAKHRLAGVATPDLPEPGPAA
jgi:CRP-like cAMP-binding protein